MQQNTVRLKPAKPSSGSRIPLHALDRLLSFFIPLNLFFKPSSSGPTQLQDFADSLQNVVDRLPMIAGSICTVDGPHGVKLQELVDDGHGVDLIWVDSPIPLDSHPESVSLMPRDALGDIESADQTILMVKFTKFTCGTLAMCISISHMFCDLTSYFNLIKDWARVTRGDTTIDPFSVSSWDRNPGKFFPPPTLSTLLQQPPANDASIPPRQAPRPATAPHFFLTWESLRELKNACNPTEPNAWISTGDCVGALLWRAFAAARKGLLDPGCDVQLHVTVDGRSLSKMQPDASRYFGNLQTPATVTLTLSALLESSLASIALVIRRALDEQITDANCANILASLDAELSKKTDPGSNKVIPMVTNWTKVPLLGEGVDFGAGPPFWETTGLFRIGMLVVLPQKDGYLCSLAIETDLASKLLTDNELLAYAKPVTSRGQATSKKLLVSHL